MLALAALTTFAAARAEPVSLVELDIRLSFEAVNEPSGTVVEAWGPSGRVLGIGFPEHFNTLRHHNDRLLNVFLQDGDESVEIIPLGKPAGWVSGFFHLSHVGEPNLTVVNPAASWQRSRLNPRTGAWEPLDRDGFSLAQMLAYGFLPNSFPEDCGFVMFARASHGLFGNCLIQRGGKTLSLLAVGRSLGIPQDHRLRPRYFGSGVLVLDEVSAASAIESFVTCRIGGGLSFSGCSRVTFKMLREFLYAVGRNGGSVAITSSFGNIWAVDVAGGPVRQIRESDGRSLQLYSAIRLDGADLWGEYPNGLAASLGRRGEIAPAGLQLPIEHYSRTAGAELQSFALYKGELHAGVWPFGELYVQSSQTGRWSLLRRLFSSPEIGPNAQAPFLDRFQDNEAGQRITDMIAFGDSLYVATASKSGLLDVLQPRPELEALLPEYGRFWRIRRSGALAAPLPPARRVEVKLSVFRDRLVLSYRGREIGSAAVRGETLPCIDRFEARRGRFGDLIHAEASVTVKRNGLACADASKDRR